MTFDAERHAIRQVEREARIFSHGPQVVSLQDHSIAGLAMPSTIAAGVTIAGEDRLPPALVRF